MVYDQRFEVRGFVYVLKARELENRPYGTFSLLFFILNRCDHALHQIKHIYSFINISFSACFSSRIMLDDLSGLDGFKPVEHDRDIFGTGLIVIL